MQTVDRRTLSTVPTAPTATTAAVSILPRFPNSTPKGDTFQLNTTSPDWNNDREWRLVSKPIQRNLSHRPHRSRQIEIPYIKFKLQESTKPLRIPKILIGRGLNRRIAEQEIRSILDESSATVCSIGDSKVPYRSFYLPPEYLRVQMRLIEKMQGN